MTRWDANIDGSRYVAKVAAERYTDFPAYTGGNLAGLYDAGYGNLEFYYTDTTPDEYRAYISMLDGKGFVRHMENTIGSNLYTTLTSSDGMLHAYYIVCEKAVRIVTAPKGGYTLPRFEPEKVTKITEPKMTQMSLDYAAGNFGMCYIFTLEDGSFVIVDGGGTKGNDTAKLYKLLGTLNERPIRMRYLPKVVRYFFNNLIINIGLMSVLRCKSNQKRSKNYHVYNSFLVFSV